MLRAQPTWHGLATICIAWTLGAMPTSGAEPIKLSADRLPNAYQIHPRVISGGLPEGDAAFRQLAELGVQTIISVDGAKPDLALAQKYGLRYVHLPHGYDGVPEQRMKELAKAVRDLPGPIYIHCHHGKHRSPAAAAVACVAAGLLEPASAEIVLKAAGTSDSYRGLYQAARAARPLDPKMLNELPADFPATSKVPPLAAAMIPLEHAHDHLKEIAAAGWKAPPEHPDLDPAHEVLLLREALTETRRAAETDKRPASFQEFLLTSETAARTLDEALRANAPTAATAAWQQIIATCTACHREHRDNAR